MHPITPRDAQRLIRQIVFPNHVQRVAFTTHFRYPATAGRHLHRLVISFARDGRAAARRWQERTALAELCREIVQRAGGRSEGERHRTISTRVAESPSIHGAFEFVRAGQQVRWDDAVAGRVAQRQQARLRRGGVGACAGQLLQPLAAPVLSRADGEPRVAEKGPVPGRIVLRPRLDLQAKLDRLARMGREVEVELFPLSRGLMFAHQLAFHAVGGQVAGEGGPVALVGHARVRPHHDAERKLDGREARQRELIFRPRPARWNTPRRMDQQRLAAKDAAPRFVGNTRALIGMPRPRHRHPHRLNAVGLPPYLVKPDVGEGGFSGGQRDQQVRRPGGWRRSAQSHAKPTRRHRPKKRARPKSLQTVFHGTFPPADETITPRSAGGQDISAPMTFSVAATMAKAWAALPHPGPLHEPQGRARHSVRADLDRPGSGAHGVTRPTIAGRFRGPNRGFSRAVESLPLG